MGYYTRYKLTIEEGDDYTTDHEEGVSENTGYSNCFEYEIKWYSFDEDMKNYSKNFPDTVFKLSGEGEENGDIWYRYYKNGKVQVCKATFTFEPYDVNNLK